MRPSRTSAKPGRASKPRDGQHPDDTLPDLAALAESRPHEVYGERVLAF